LIIIGGAEDKVGKKTILKYVADIVREKKGSLVILTTATQKPQEVGNNYRQVFETWINGYRCVEYKFAR